MIVLSSFKLGLNLFFRRKINLLWAIIPFFLGIILYFAFGAWMFGILQALAGEILQQKLLNTFAATVTTATIGVMIAVVLYFLFNWLFLMCVFFLSYPFHKMIAKNTEQEIGAPSALEGCSTKRGFLTEIWKVILNLVLTVMVFAGAFIPPLSIISVIASSLIISIQFVDYTWSKHNLSFRDCLTDLKKYFFNYAVMGLMGLFFMAIPFLNVMFMPVFVSIYTALFYKQRGLV